MTDQTLFSDQAKRRPDAEQGQKVVYEGDPTPTLPDGRRDGSGHHSFEALRGRSGLTRREKALLMLYRNPEGITSRDFYQAYGSTRLAARIHELRETDDAPPIRDRTKQVSARDGSETTVSEYYIPRPTISKRYEDQSSDPLSATPRSPPRGARQCCGAPGGQRRARHGSPQGRSQSRPPAPGQDQSPPRMAPLVGVAGAAHDGGAPGRGGWPID